ncbi:Gly-Xaa carboxypeptidase [Lachancea thermotolerans CBS 6340]|uniref:KLTH0F04422p n=1 Tax=Lachancea thermotolerans (strain ATCC 56472 / CBS 6340 / NRRL Y-8284) TaxID=559295 RepID=C5DKG2_LACTC|nr:KLTH0F04422p [Lachancea thermotolerans CBS 6340]CAR23963.1 KLTH0F04422p [Lachancea thermotolerans CBS 6340]
MQGGYDKLPGSSTGRFGQGLKKSAMLAAGTLAFAAIAWRTTGDGSLGMFQAQETPKCGRIEPLRPRFNKSIEMIFEDAKFREESLAKLSGAVRIPTEIQDVNPQPADDLDYYKEFFRFHEYLKQTFPLVHKHLKLEKVNHVNLLYTWEGSDASLEPMMLTAHQDVVPVNPDTVDQWTFPPFSGHYDNTTDYVWGRGTGDCKNLLIGELEAIELLLKDGFKPRRSVIVALGFDEESSGILGANTLGDFLYERYGDNGIYSVVDEGGGVIQLGKKVFVAAPITAEKGYVDIEVTVNGVGGHSSVPPDHTTIGVAANMISLLEANPFEPTFTPKNPIYGLLTCAAEHGDNLPSSVRKAILQAPHDEKQKEKMVSFFSTDKRLRDLMRTSQAVDIIRGGIKANALPEVTTFLVNHRIDVNSSVSQTVERDLALIKTVAEKFNYGLFLAGEEIIPPTKFGFIDVEPQKSLEPAPISPTVGSPTWDLFAGTIQDVFQNGHFKYDPDTEFYVSTGLVSGNTDTKYYWRLTKNIYRFLGLVMEADIMRTIHSVNEHIRMSGHLSTVAFVYEYIVNVNEQA